MVAVPVSHFSASHKKGSMLLLDHGFPGGDKFCDSVLSNCAADHVIGGGVNWDLFHRLGRRVFQQLQAVVSHGSWLILS